jgi:hypothetical protein
VVSASIVCLLISDLSKRRSSRDRNRSSCPLFSVSVASALWVSFGVWLFLFLSVALIPG